MKALIASESSFKPEEHNQTKNEKLGKAHGLMQILDVTLTYLAGHKGGVKEIMAQP